MRYLYRNGYRCAKSSRFMCFVQRNQSISSTIPTTPTEMRIWERMRNRETWSSREPAAASDVKQDVGGSHGSKEYSEVFGIPLKAYEENC